MSELFPGVDMTERYAGFNRAGAPFGIAFNARTRLSNSRLALEASEFARDAGQYHSFHVRVFHAYFTENLDIGDTAVIMDLASKEGLDGDELAAALRDGQYGPRLDRAMEDAQRYRVTAIPTFVVDGAMTLVGAQSLDVFRKQLRKILA
jgi:predicted DsbA family dithiol-disulfide isomerase